MLVKNKKKLDSLFLCQSIIKFFINTSRWLVALDGSNADISQISHVQCSIWRHHQRGRTVEPGIFSIPVSYLIAVTVGIILQGRR